MKSIILIAVGLCGINIEDIRREFPISPADSAIASDAIERYAKINGVTTEYVKEHVLEDALIIIVRFPKKRCVVFKMTGLVIGSPLPIYCYSRDNDALVEIFETGAQ
jgi:hypothetical protein